MFQYIIKSTASKNKFNKATEKIKLNSVYKYILSRISKACSICTVCCNNVSVTTASADRACPLNSTRNIFIPRVSSDYNRRIWQCIKIS